jgi:hypothetical protein
VSIQHLPVDGVGEQLLPVGRSIDVRVQYRIAWTGSW